jgi:hypothetical protein
MRTIGPCSLVFGMMVMLSGCMTGPHIIENNDPYSNCEPGSSEWWFQKAQIQPGVRQKCKKGKIWPPRPRPTGEGQQFSHTFHSAHYWPLPYVCQDRQYVNDILEAQMSNGWMEETTLYHRHFSADDQMLSRPGQLHLQRILETAPSQRRAIYIQSTRDPGIDNVRLSHVQDAIAEITFGTESIPVSVRVGREYSRPASEVQAVNALYNASIPAPRLAGSTGSGGSTAAAGGGAAPVATP